MNSKQKRIIIVGAGASGLAAAISIKKNCRDLVHVTLIERNSKIGKKLLATGNGRCNLTNVFVNKNCYNNPEFMDSHLKIYGFDAVKSFYEDLGLLISRPDNEGRVYPATFSSASVVDCYLNAINNLKIELKLECEVVDIVKSNDGFIVKTTENGETSNQSCDYLILSYGSSAQTGFANNFSLSGLKFTKLTCSLCPLIAKKSELKHLENVRSKANVTLEYFKNNIKQTYSERGEVLFKTERISGIVAMNISAIMARNHLENANIFIDLFPDFSIDEILIQLKKNASHSKRLLDLLTGICVKGLALNVIERIIKSKKKHLTESNWSECTLKEIALLLKNLPLYTTLNTNKNESTTINGGISLSCICNNTFQIKDTSGLFIIGEALDIDGICGGYNLHFAVSSALSAAKEIAKNALN